MLFVPACLSLPTGLAGYLPPAWALLTNLTLIDLSNNSLEAGVPPLWISLTQAYIVLNNNTDM